MQLICEVGLLSAVLDKRMDLVDAFQVASLEAARVVQNEVLILARKGNRVPDLFPLRPDSTVTDSRLFPAVSRMRVSC